MRLIKSIFVRFFEKSILRPKFFLSFFLFLLLLGGSQLKNIQFLFDIDDLIDQDFVSYRALKILEDDFNIRNSIHLTFKKKDHLTIGDICLIDQWLAKISLENSHISSIYSGTRISKTYWDQEYLGLKHLFPIDECKITDARKVDIPKNPWGNIFFSSKKNDLSVEIHLNPPPSGFFLGGFDPSVVDSIKKHLDKFISQHNSSLEVLWMGNGVFQFYMQKGHAQIQVINLLVIILIFILFKFYFGTFKSGIIFISTLLISILIVYMLLGFLHYPIDVLTNSLFILLAIASIEDFIFISNDIQLYKKKWNRLNWKLSFKKYLVPSFFTSLTTMIGFGSLFFADLEIIQRFGIASMLGAFIEWVVMLFVLPVLMSLFPVLREWTKEQKKRSFSNDITFSQGKLSSKFICIIMLLVPIYVFVNGINLNIDDSPEKVFSKNHPITKNIEYLKKTRNWVAVVPLIFESEKSNKLMMDNVLEKLNQLSIIVDTEKLADIESHYIGDIESAGIQQIVIGQVRKSSFYKRLKNEHFERVNLFLSAYSVKDLKNLDKVVSSVCPDKECFLAGDYYSYSEFATLVPNTLLKSLFISLCLVVIVLSYLYFKKFKFNLENFREFLFLVISSLWGPCFVLCFISYFNIEVNFVTCVFASVLVGLAGDNGVQYIFASKDSLLSGVFEREVSSIQIFIISFLLPLCFTFAYFNPTQILGYLFALGALSGILGDLFLLKTLLLWKRKSF